jgi:hypothetical protein
VLDDVSDRSLTFNFNVPLRLLSAEDARHVRIHWPPGMRVLDDLTGLSVNVTSAGDRHFGRGLLSKSRVTSVCAKKSSSSSPDAALSHLLLLRMPTAHLAMVWTHLLQSRLPTSGREGTGVAPIPVQG